MLTMGSWQYQVWLLRLKIRRFLTYLWVIFVLAVRRASCACNKNLPRISSEITIALAQNYSHVLPNKPLKESKRSSIRLIFSEVVQQFSHKFIILFLITRSKRYLLNNDLVRLPQLPTTGFWHDSIVAWFLATTNCMQNSILSNDRVLQIFSRCQNSFIANDLRLSNWVYARI